jgi:hypothetical protein
MTAIDITVTLTDDRTGCTHTADHAQTNNWSRPTRLMVELLMPGCYPDYASHLSRYGDGKAHGPIRDSNGNRVGSFDVVDKP